MKTIFNNSQPGTTKVSHALGIGAETINSSGPASMSQTRPIIGDRITPEYMSALAVAYNTANPLAMLRLLWEIQVGREAVQEAIDANT